MTVEVCISDSVRRNHKKARQLNRLACAIQDWLNHLRHRFEAKSFWFLFVVASLPGAGLASPKRKLSPVSKATMKK
jgi:hypothetical protein